MDKPSNYIQLITAAVLALGGLALLFFHVRQDTDTEVYHAKDVLFLHKLYAV